MSLKLSGKLMETVIINSRIKKKNKTELYQTLESLTPLIKANCQDFELKINPDDTLFMEITFDSRESFENNFYQSEFVILKGTLKSLCDNVRIKVNDSLVNNS
jgi:hypothetical protein